MKKAGFITLGVLIALIISFILAYQPDLDKELLTKKYTNQYSRFKLIDGVNVHYRSEGSGPVLLLLHGTASSLHTWDEWTKVLKQNYTVLRLDLPGFGLTGPHPQRNYSIRFYSDFTKRFLDSLGVDTLSIAGNSMGGNIAWNMASDYPAKVRKLILIDASGYPDDDTPLVIKLARNPLSAWFIGKITPRSLIESNLEEVYYQDSLVTDELVNRHFELTLYPGNRQAFIDKSRIRKEDHSNLLSSLSQPVFIQWGRFDQWIPLKDAYKFHKDIPHSRLKIYEAGHVPMEELPRETAKDALQFLEESSKTGVID